MWNQSRAQPETEARKQGAHVAAAVTLAPRAGPWLAAVQLSKELACFRPSHLDRKPLLTLRNKGFVTRPTLSLLKTESIDRRDRTTAGMDFSDIL